MYRKWEDDRSQSKRDGSGRAAPANATRHFILSIVFVTTASILLVYIGTALNTRTPSSRDASTNTRSTAAGPASGLGRCSSSRRYVRTISQVVTTLRTEIADLTVKMDVTSTLDPVEKPRKLAEHLSRINRLDGSLSCALPPPNASSGTYSTSQFAKGLQKLLKS